MGLRAKALQEDIYKRALGKCSLPKALLMRKNGYGTDDRR